MNLRINGIDSSYLKIKYLDFDTRIFGFVCGRLYIKRRDLSEKIIESALRKAKKLGFRHLVIKVHSEHVYLCNLLENFNFKFKTCSLELEKKEFTKKKRVSNVFLYDSKYKDQLVSITKEGFSGRTRFHFEGEFEKRKIDELYEKWTLNLVRDKSVKIFVYILRKLVKGYVTVKLLDRKLEKAHIGLFAVLSNQRGKGVGTQLLERVEAEMPGSIKSLTVMTESINYPALKTYIRSGFVITKSWNIFHLIL
mgnify:CR=1 FL=1